MTEAIEVYNTFTFDPEEDKNKLDAVLKQFDEHCLAKKKAEADLNLEKAVKICQARELVRAETFDVADKGLAQQPAQMHGDVDAISFKESGAGRTEIETLGAKKEQRGAVTKNAETRNLPANDVEASTRPDSAQHSEKPAPGVMDKITILECVFQGRRNEKSM